MLLIPLRNQQTQRLHWCAWINFWSNRVFGLGGYCWIDRESSWREGYGTRITFRVWLFTIELNFWIGLNQLDAWK